jgi:hypothetical protein
LRCGADLERVTDRIAGAIVTLAGDASASEPSVIARRPGHDEVARGARGNVRIPFVIAADHRDGASDRLATPIERLRRHFSIGGPRHREGAVLGHRHGAFVGLSDDLEQVAARRPAEIEPLEVVAW